MYYIRKKLFQTMKDLIHKVVKNSKQNISKALFYDLTNCTPYVSL